MKRPWWSIGMIVFVIVHASVTVECFLFSTENFLTEGPDRYAALRGVAGCVCLVFAFPFVYFAMMLSGVLMPVSLNLAMGAMLLGVLGNSTFWWYSICMMGEDLWRSRDSHKALLPDSIEFPGNEPGN